MSNLDDYMNAVLRGEALKKAQAKEKAMKKPTYMDFLPEDGNFTEEDLWEAIAEANGLDYSEIADGDLAEWL